MILLGVSGKLGVGKNYITENYLVPKLIERFSNKNVQYVPYFFSFGTQVKIELYSRDTISCLNYHNLFVEKSNHSRTCLQQYATDNGRDKYRKDMWIRAIDMWIKVQLNNLDIVNKHIIRKLVPIFVVEDVRFENEYEYIKSNSGILVLVESGYRNFEKILQEINNKKSENNENNETIHESEKGLEHLEFHLRINNDPVNSDTIEFIIDEFIECLVVPMKPCETK
jgi:hypothetical protein